MGLEPLPLEVAICFLLERTGQDDAAAARAIAEAVGGLPLALEQAAAYLIENDWRSLADYAQLLQTRITDLLREGKPDDYPLPVAGTWDLSFQRIEQEQPAAADLLRLCAFLAPDDIPTAVLQAVASEQPDRLRKALRDEIECDRTLAALRRYSLLERQEDGLRVHRLVQWGVRESSEVEPREHWLAAAVRLLAAAFPGEVKDPERRPLCARLLPHAQVVITLVGDREVEPEATSWLLDRVASYLQIRGEYVPAGPLFERALAINERVPGPHHPATAGSLNNLAGLLQAQGQLAAARPLCPRAQLWWLKPSPAGLAGRAMAIYHFGNREQLVAEVVTTVRRRLVEQLVGERCGFGPPGHRSRRQHHRGRLGRDRRHRLRHGPERPRVRAPSG